ncbi:MAG: hypothetical protein WDN48_02650 [Pseudolabrys sp.]
MKRLIFYALAWTALTTVAANAAPARCSDEQKACVAVCKKTTIGSDLPTCITNCGTRQSVCVHTGCWNSGTSGTAT